MHTLPNTHGEKLRFLRLLQGSKGELLEIESWEQPGAGLVMYVHWKQDESLTVGSGKMGTQVPEQAIQYYGPATFLRGT